MRRCLLLVLIYTGLNACDNTNPIPNQSTLAQPVMTVPSEQGDNPSGQIPKNVSPEPVISQPTGNIPRATFPESAQSHSPPRSDFPTVVIQKQPSSPMGSSSGTSHSSSSSSASQSTVIPIFSNISTVSTAGDTPIENKQSPGLLNLEADIATHFTAIDFENSQPTIETPLSGQIVQKRPLLYVSGGNLYKTSLQGEQVQLTNTPYPEIYPVSSPDGKHIVFASNRLKRGWELFALAPTDAIRLSFQYLKSQPTDWSVNNELLLLDRHQLHVYDFKTQQFRQLLAGISVSSPIWSPDGKEIAFVYQGHIASTDRLGQQFQIRVSDIRVTGRLDWGKEFVYESDRQLYTVPVDGGMPIPIPIESYASEPVWSPDNRYIAFISNKSQLNILDLNSHIITHITQGGENIAEQPNW